jgi:type VI secretion system secreted protein VgrG
MQPAANINWFGFSVKGGPSFGVYSFKGHEAVSEPFEFAVELVSYSTKEDIIGLMGSEACLSVADRTGERRRVNGVIRQMEQLHTANVRTHYRCLLVPRLWFLQQTCNHRIFQDKSVVDIISQILQEQGFTDSSYSFKCFTKYEARGYCVQYGESDFHFISRLCEEEGIYYYFEHTDDTHCLCFSDMPGGPPIPGESALRFFPGSGENAGAAVIARLNLHHGIYSDAVTYREWNFKQSSLDLTAQDSEPDARKAPAPGGVLMETYQFPHLYQSKDSGKRYAQIQLMRQLTFHAWIDGQSDVSRFTPGFTFSVREHYRPDVNTTWWVTAVEHRGEQPGVLEHEAPDDRGLEYNAHFTAIPHETRFVPEICHPKVRVEGLQSAIVSGPAGEEIYCDKYGRVKVQFHWDREGKHDENTTCWVRVADTWAGANFGSIRVPRIGQEVIVEYMEGDPDRPVITGRVYYAPNQPPWELPEQKILSGVQSREFHGTQRNQLVLDDTNGQVQAQISSDHDLSQLNLGYITRVNHLEGRKDFRGEGFELRTDGWGVVRAGKGLVLTAQGREKAEKHQKDLREPLVDLEDAAHLHAETAKLSATHNAMDKGADADPLKEALDRQNADIKGDGRVHGEMSKPHLLLAAPAGIAATTPHSLHSRTGEHTLLTSAGHTSIVSGQSLLGTALNAVRLFAHKCGIRLFAGQGKVEIQAQSDELDVIAQKVLRIISTQESIQLTAAREILLCADGSYIRVSGHGVESGTRGRFVARAASHSLEGPDSESPAIPDLPEGAILFQNKYVVEDEFTREPIDKMRYEITYPNGSKVTGVTGKDGMLPEQKSLQPDLLTIRLLGVEK